MVAIDREPAQRHADLAAINGWEQRAKSSAGR